VKVKLSCTQLEDAHSLEL